MAKSPRTPKSGGDLQRKPASRTPSYRILIITEGTKTEPQYFKLLINELKILTANVKIIKDCGSAPANIAEEAEKILSYDDDYQKIYCVFDRDRHATYDKALEMIEKISKKRQFINKEIKAITSVPCFEYWYLLHVSDSRKPYESSTSPGDALIEDLKQKSPFERYSKNNCNSFFSLISSNRGIATDRATRYLEQSKSEGFKAHHENPSTRVHIVVQSLIELSNINR